ncbi:phosphonopyruvate decarboxylase [uncultured Clostridium sp.]|uniref:phosphonopyruvate decarboxylase n=1 Tax=uncultured Clostridium sp. TaxID=59620 RepID=UPI0028E5A5D5|nr:phosphonopyruvate decarboxylase [uncultured Clostridium sp.]
MIEPKRFHALLEEAGIKFYTGVPDSLLNDFCLYLSNNMSKDQHIIAANEGNAIAIAAGYYLATGTVPLVYMQNSGIGNSLNPLISLTNKETYEIPIVLLIGWRGSPDIDDWSHHKKQGEQTTILMEALDIPYRILEGDGDKVFDLVKWATETALQQSCPTAILVKKGVLAKDKKENLLLQESVYSMSRENAIECIINLLPQDTIFVVTTGRATREIFEIRNKYGKGHECDFLNVGAMGHASSIALGLSVGNKNRLVVCLDGDASAIMHLGSFITAGTSGQSNLLHIVLNNGAHESVGGQPSAGYKVNFTGMAENAGYKTVGHAVKDREGLEKAVEKLMEANGPAFIDMRIRKGIREDIPNLNVLLSDAKKQLMEELKSN